MDINWARSLFTVLVFISFILILYIVCNRHNKKNYDDVAQSIINDEDIPDEKDNHNNQLYRDNGAK